MRDLCVPVCNEDAGTERPPCSTLGALVLGTVVPLTVAAVWVR